MKNILYSALAMIMLITVACSSTKSGTASTSTTKSSSGAATKSDSDNLENLNASTSLADQLRRIPGVSVIGSGSGARATIRGNASTSGDSEPLYVLDGTPLNGGLAYASSVVPVAEIKSIKVLKTASETSPYGMRGSYGVIEITLKH
ncbi:MAG: TonB-dependent receptor plug domain-containing protein [Bacteroidota bacterium]|nr:TonB-dependent receptor plug domain-containing protein [Bacteroidota bacterium]